MSEPFEVPMTRKCKRCKADFQTTSRVKKRCDACRKVVKAENTARSSERRAARRLAARQSGIEK